jgi:hypothetical protein
MWMMRKVYAADISNVKLYPSTMPSTIRPARAPNSSADPRHSTHDIVGACRRLHAAIDRLDERVAAAAGISRSDLRCLNLLEFGPLPATVIARQLNLATGSVTALIDRLEAKGLVARLRQGTDRRVVQVQATARVFEVVGPIYLGFASRLRQQVKTYRVAERKLAVKHLLDVAESCDMAAAVPA